jgi:hypothetical protein
VVPFSCTSPTLMEVRDIICEPLIRVHGTQGFAISAAAFIALLLSFFFDCTLSLLVLNINIYSQF